MKNILPHIALLVSLTAQLVGASVDKATFFCPWVYGTDAKVPDELVYFNTTDPNVVGEVIESTWDASTNAAKAYFLLYTKFRDHDLYEKLTKRIQGRQLGDVEVRSGSIIMTIAFADVQKRIEILTYDWAGVPASW